MGRRFTLLEDLCGHVLLTGADSMRVEYRDRRAWVFGQKSDAVIPFANFAGLGAEAKDLYRARQRPVRTVLDGRVYLLKARISNDFGEDAFTVEIEPAPKPDPASAPRFTKTQGQYLAFIFSYTKIHGLAPAESDLQLYFRVSPPSVHEMIKTLERNGFIERTAGQARSLRLLVPPERLPLLA